MKTILKYIEDMHLSRMSVAAQEVWLNSFASLVHEKQREVSAKARAEEIHAKLLDGEVDNPDAYSAKDIAEAIEDIRDRRERFGGSKVGGGGWCNYTSLWLVGLSTMISQLIGN